MKIKHVAPYFSIFQFFFVRSFVPYPHSFVYRSRLDKARTLLVRCMHIHVYVRIIACAMYNQTKCKSGKRMRTKEKKRNMVICHCPACIELCACVVLGIFVRCFSEKPFWKWTLKSVETVARKKKEVEGNSMRGSHTEYVTQRWNMWAQFTTTLFPWIFFFLLLKSQYDEVPELLT